MKARNIDDPPPALRHDPGLCNRFGQTDGRGPLHGRRLRRSPVLGPTRTAPGRRDVHFALERALLTAHLEGEMHLSRAKCTSRRAQDRPAHHHPERLPPAPPRAASHRPGPRTTTPGEKGSMGWRLACRDAADLLGPLAFRWTTWFTKYGGPTAHKWSKQKSASTSPQATPRPAPASPPAEQPSGPARAEPASGPNDKGIEGVDIIIAADEGPRRLSRARGVRIQRGLFAFAGAIGAQRQGCTDPVRPACHRLQQRRTIPASPRRCPTSRGSPPP